VEAPALGLFQPPNEPQIIPKQWVDWNSLGANCPADALSGPLPFLKLNECLFGKLRPQRLKVTDLMQLKQRSAV
jgi:hypothetical protein